MSYGGDFRRGEVMNISNWVLTGFAIGMAVIVALEVLEIRSLELTKYNSTRHNTRNIAISSHLKFRP